MKQFLNSIITLGLLVLATLLFFIGISYHFSSALINIILFVVAIFVLLQGCGNIDKMNGYGKYADKNKSDEHDNHAHRDDNA